MSDRSRLVIASANPDKAAEIARSCSRRRSATRSSCSTGPTDVGEVEETGATLEENARLKARGALPRRPGWPRSPTTPASRSRRSTAPGRLLGALRRRATPATPTTSTSCSPRSTARRPRAAISDGRASIAFPDGTELVAEGAVDGRDRRASRGEAGFRLRPGISPARRRAHLRGAELGREARGLAPRPGGAKFAALLRAKLDGETDAAARRLS